MKQSGPAYADYKSEHHMQMQNREDERRGEGEYSRKKEVERGLLSNVYNRALYY